MRGSLGYDIHNVYRHLSMHTVHHIIVICVRWTFFPSSVHYQFAVGVQFVDYGDFHEIKIAAINVTRRHIVYQTSWIAFIAFQFI